MKKWIVAVLIVLLATIGVAGNSYYSQTAPEPPQQPITRTTTVRPEREPITADSLFEEVNKQRVEAGIAKLNRNALLDKSASAKCADMAENDYYGHVNPVTGKRGGTYIFDYIPGAPSGGENLAAGLYFVDEEVVDDWMESESHRSAILDATFIDSGISVCAYKNKSGKLYFVQHFVRY